MGSGYAGRTDLFMVATQEKTIVREFVLKKGLSPHKTANQVVETAGRYKFTFYAE